CFPGKPSAIARHQSVGTAGSAWRACPLPIAVAVAAADGLPAKTIAAGPADGRRWMMACLAVGPILGFTAISLTGGRVLPHWAAPGYLMLFALRGVEVAALVENGDRLVRVWLMTTAGSLAVVLGAVIAMSHFPWPAITGPGGRAVPYPLLESLDWKDVK